VSPVNLCACGRRSSQVRTLLTFWIRYLSSEAPLGGNSHCRDRYAGDGGACPGWPGYTSRLLRYTQTIHLNLKQMVNPDTVDAIGLRRRSALWLCVHYFTVDQEVDLVSANTHLECIG
jgi:hypothetical protein